MAIEDSLGRSVNIDANLADIKAMISSLMQGKVGAATKVGDGKSVSDEKLKEVVGLLDKLNNNMVKELQETRKYLADVVKMANTKTSSTEKPNLSEGATEAVTSTEKYIKEMHKHATTAGSLYVADIATHKLLNAILTQGFKVGAVDVNAELQSMKAEAGTKAAPAATIGVDAKTVAKLAERAGLGQDDIDKLSDAARGFRSSVDYSMDNFGSRTNTILENASLSIQRTLFGLDEKGSLGQQVFGGIVDEEIKFIKASRAAAYEVSGITSETRGLQKEFTKLEQSAYLTGFGRTELQKQYLDNVKKGIKDQKVAKALSVTQLQTAKQLGLEANAFDETFRDLNLAGGMSVNQISDMANGLKSAARNAGIAGEQLKKAVDSAQQINKIMMSAATLTSAAAKNVTGILASAEKFGVGDQAAEFLKATQSSANLLLSASDETKNLLYNAAASVGRIGDLQKGILLRSKSGIKDLRKGFDNILKTFGVESAEAIDNLSDESKMQLNIQLKSAFGMELGDFQRQIQALKEQESGLADKMAEINKERKKSLSTEEKLALAEKERKAKIEASVGALAALEEASKGAKDMNQALRKFGDRKSEFESDIKALGGDFRSSASAAKTALTSAIENVNEGLTKAGKSKLEISSDEITRALKDPTALKEVTAKITKGNQEMETAQKAQLDPMSAVEQSAKELNDQFRSYSGPALQSLTDIATKTGMMAVAFGTMATSGFFETGKVYQRLGPAFESIKGFFKQSMALGEGKGNTGFGTVLSALKDTGQMIFSQAFDLKAASKAFEEGVSAASIFDAMKKAVGKPAEAAATKEAEKGPPGTRETPSPTAPKTAAGDGVQAALELILEEINVVRQTVKDQMVRVKIEEDFYDFWKKETKKVVKAILFVSKKEMSAAKKTADESLGGAGGPATGGEAAADVAAPTGGLLDFLKDGAILEQAGDALMEYGPMLALLAAGLVAVATAVMAVMNQVFKFTGLDLATAAKTAATIGVILGATAALFAATIAGYKQLNEIKGELDKLDWRQGLQVGIKLSALAIGLSALGLATIFVIKTMASMFGIDIAAAAETGANIAAVMGVVAAIAVAVQETLPKLIEFAPVLDQAKSKVGEIVKGGAALLILAPAMVLLGIGVLSLVRLLSWALGVDWDKALEIGYATAAILGVTAAIAAATVGALYGLFVLGSNVELLMSSLPIIGKGALALLVAAPVLAFLGIAVLSLIRFLSFLSGIDYDKVLEIGYTFAAILGVTAAIAVACIGALYGLAALGLMVPMLLLNLPNIWLGAEALLKATPALAALGIAVLSMIRFLSYLADIDYDKVWEIGYTMAAILGVTAALAAMMIPALYGLGALGALAKAMWWAAGLILVGIVAFSAGMIVFGLLAYEIALFGRHLEDMGLDSSVLESINTSVIMMESIFKSIAATLNTFAQEIIPLFDGFLFFDSVADDILDAMPQIQESFYGITTFIYEGILLPVLLMPPPAMLQKAQETLSALPPIFSSLASVINTLANEIAPLFDGWLWFNSVADDINDALPQMKETIPAILRFVEEAIIDPVFLNIGNPRDVKMAAEALEGVSKAIEVLPSVITGISDNLQPLLKKGWWSGLSKLDTVDKTIAEIGGRLGGVFKFVDQAIITPIFENIGNPRDVKIAAEAMEGVAKMLPLIPEAVTGISDHIGPLMKKSWWGLGSSKIDNAGKAAKDLGDTFAGLCKFVDVAIVTPIFENIGNPRDVKIAAEALEGVSKMLPLLPDTVNGISKNIKPLVKKGGLFGSSTSKLENVQQLIDEVGPQFANIFKFVDEGIITPIFENIGNPGDVKIAGEALKSTNELLTMLPAQIVDLTNNMNSMGNLSKFVNAAFDPNALQGVLFVVSKAAGDLIAIDTHFANIANALESIYASMNKIGAAGGKLAALDVDNIAMNISNGLTKVGTAVASTAPAITNTAANVQQQLELQSATAPTSTNVTSTDLSQLNENSAKELTVNEEMKNLLEKILVALAPSPQGPPPAGVTPASITTKAGNSFRLATGRYTESSAVGVTNL